jgi:hypothetical protein
MRNASFPDAELRFRREVFLELVARAQLAPPDQRADLLRDAATIATLHEELTGTPLLTDIAEYLRAGGRDDTALSG